MPGAMVMSAFAAVWCLVGISGVERVSRAFYLVPILITGAIIALAVRYQAQRTPPASGERPRIGRVVGIASGVEGIAILVTVRVLVTTRHPTLIAPVVAIIVGLHFVPLARGLSAPLYYLTCALLVAIGAAGFGIADAALRLPFVCFGAAAALWTTSLIVLRRVDRSR